MVSWSMLGSLFVPYISALVIILVTFVLAWLVNLIIPRLVRQSSPQMGVAARRLGVAVVALIGGTLAVQALGVSPGILLLVIAMVGVAILLALWAPLTNYGAKYFADIYTPFRVGDTIKVQGYSGKVLEINAMSTILLTDDEQLVSVPNMTMIQDVVINTSPQAWKEVVIPVSLSGNIDLAVFESDLRKSLAKLRTRFDRRFPPVLTTKSRTPQTTELVLIVMLRRPEDRDAVTVEVNQRLTEVLEQVRGVRR